MDYRLINSAGASISPFDCLIFDLDDTLYPSDSGIGQALKRNVHDFLSEICGFSESEAVDVNRELFRTYGSSLAGLRASGYDINPDDYHSFVHGRLPYELIQQNMELRNILQTIKQRKIIFTNSDRVHATKALDRLGIRDCFDRIVCFETMNPEIHKSRRPEDFPVVLKPSENAFRIAIEDAGIDPRRALFFDDNVKNITAGKAAGLQTVLVGKLRDIHESDYKVETINNIVHVIPEIWRTEESEPRKIPLSEMNPVQAPTTQVGA